MLNENLKRLRKNKGLTQEQFALQLNVVRQTVSKWEQGLSVPDAEMLMKIADILNVSVSDLLGEEVAENNDISLYCLFVFLLIFQCFKNRIDMRFLLILIFKKPP